METFMMNLIRISQTILQCKVKEKEIEELKDNNGQLEAKLNKLMDEVTNYKKTLEKMKRDKAKVEKDNETNKKDLSDQLSKSYAEVKRYCNENTILLEEKKVLMGIHQVNSDLHEKLRNIRKQDEITIESEDVVTDDDDEESVAYNLQQRARRFNRTMPAAEASGPSNQNAGADQRTTGANAKVYKCDECDFQTSNGTHIKGHKTGHKNQCSLCNLMFKTVGLLRRHMKDEHNTKLGQERQQNGESNLIKCSECRFEATTNENLKKHFEDRHNTRKNTAWVFWPEDIAQGVNPVNFHTP